MSSRRVRTALSALITLMLAGCLLGLGLLTVVQVKTPAPAPASAAAPGLVPVVSCSAHPLDLAKLRQANFVAVGSMSAADPRMQRLVHTSDSRNFIAQMSQSDLDVTGALEGRQYGHGGRIVVVASYGDLSSLAAGLPAGSVRPDLFLDIVDANTAAELGYAFITPGCHQN